MGQTNYLRDSFKSIGRSLSLQSQRGSQKHFSSDASQSCPFRGDWLFVNGRALAQLARLAMDLVKVTFPTVNISTSLGHAKSALKGATHSTAT